MKEKMNSKKVNLNDLLLEATSLGQLQGVISLVTKGAELEQHDPVHGYTPLQIACRSGFLNIVKVLVTAGADLNRPTQDGYTSLLLAAVNNHYGVVRYLVESDANIDCVTMDGNNALHIATMNNDWKTANFLIRNKIHPDIQNKMKYTPLHIATRQSSKKIVTDLLACHPDVNLPDKFGLTPLHNAACWSSNDILIQLLQAKADINAQDKEGYSPLHLAASFGLTQSVETLIHAGASMESKTKFFNTPLLEAVLQGHYETAQILLRYGANSEAANADGVTPSLAAASSKDHPQLRGLFMKPNPNLNSSCDWIDDFNESKSEDTQGFVHILDESSKSFESMDQIFPESIKSTNESVPIHEDFCEGTIPSTASSDQSIQYENIYEDPEKDTSQFISFFRTNKSLTTSSWLKHSKVTDEDTEWTTNSTSSERDPILNLVELDGISNDSWPQMYGNVSITTNFSMDPVKLDVNPTDPVTIHWSHNQSIELKIPVVMVDIGYTFLMCWTLFVMYYMTITYIRVRFPRHI